MKVLRQSQLSRLLHCRDVPVVHRSALEHYDAHKGRIPVQQAFPHLDPDDLLYVATGITPEEWHHAFPEGAAHPYRKSPLHKTQPSVTFFAES